MNVAGHPFIYGWDVDSGKSDVIVPYTPVVVPLALLASP